ncbi:MAG: 2-oxoacid:acceptor oxidoreductase family protein, partial [Planctomycetota bacterium]
MSELNPVPQVEIERITIRFAGDSGDGMQLTGSQFTSTSAIFGNDISTLPDFPAEIRAPAGSIPGVSGFQISFSSQDIQTPGDEPDVLVAMNPAALKVNIRDLPKGGVLIVNTAAFKEANLKMAGYAKNPLEDESLAGYKIYQVDMDDMVKTALKDKVALSAKEIVRC